MGAIDEAKGKGKEAVGDLTDDGKLKNEGRIDEVKGKVKDAVDRIGDKLSGK